ncbi:MAG: hypothetical protein VW642_11990, partial [Halieaceae bacterium]
MELNLESHAHQDAYFMLKADAARIAEQRNRVTLNHPTISGLQVCYFDGLPDPNDPPNLIGVRLEDTFEYFATTRNRLPTSFVGPSETPPELLDLFIQTLKAAAKERQRRRSEYSNKIKVLREPLTLNRPLKIFMPTNRLTTVMQYCSSNLAKAFESMGHEVLLSVEKNELEQLDGLIHLKLLLEFEPDIVFLINQSSILEGGLPAHIFNIVWWQDKMPELQEGKKIGGRDRDITFSALQQLDPFLENCGVPNLQRQGFCVDTNIFFRDKSVIREKKIVFVGHSYVDHLADDDTGSMLA